MTLTIPAGMYGLLVALTRIPHSSNGGWNEKEKLVLQSGTTYSVGGTGSTVTFTLGADGRATAMVLRLGNGAERTFPKVRRRRGRMSRRLITRRWP